MCSDLVPAMRMASCVLHNTRQHVCDHADERLTGGCPLQAEALRGLRLQPDQLVKMRSALAFYDERMAQIMTVSGLLLGSVIAAVGCVRVRVCGCFA